MASVNAFAAIEKVQPQVDENGCYQIGSAGELYWFASLINGQESENEGTPSVPTSSPAESSSSSEEPPLENVCAVLTQNITVNSDVIASSYSNHESWTPIGKRTRPFKGTFNGRGHTISGLYNVDGADYVGLFGVAQGAENPTVIKNVGIVDSYFSASDYVGGILGYVNDGEVKIENVFNEACELHSTDVGGIVGGTSGKITLQIFNVYNTGTVVSNLGYAGGIVGSVGNQASVHIYNGFNTGSCKIYNFGETVRTYRIWDGVNAPILKNVFYFGEKVGDDGTPLQKEEFFKNGSVAQRLHDYQDVKNGVDGSIWGQDVNNGDVHPNFSGEVLGGPEGSTVSLYFTAQNKVDSRYIPGIEQALPRKTDDGAYIVGWYENEDKSGSRMTVISSNQEGNVNLYAKIFDESDGCIVISDSSTLFAFAELANDGENTICAVLSNNIVVNSKVLNEDRSDVNENPSAPFVAWTPIGTSDSPFQGSFDGRGFTISGLYYANNQASNVGLFGMVRGLEGTEVNIKNVGIEDSYFYGKEYVGGLLGRLYASTVVIENVFNAGVVKGSNYVGGFVGEVYSYTTLRLHNAYNVGKIEANGYGTGGFVGSIQNDYNSEIVNGYNAGAVSGKSLAGSIIGRISSSLVNVRNTYYLSGQNEEEFPDIGVSASQDEFKEGAVTLKLQQNEKIDGSIWGQDVPNGETLPTFTGEVTRMELALDWEKSTDYIAMDSYDYDMRTAISRGGVVVKIAEGKKFYADGKIYSGILTSDEVKSIAGKTLYPVSGVTMDENGVALFSVAQMENEPVLIPKTFSAAGVSYDRKFVSDVYSTLMLPFSAETDGWELLQFKDVVKEDGKWVVNVEIAGNNIVANTPYIVKPATESLAFDGQVKFSPTTQMMYSKAFGKWELRGTYEYHKWTKEELLDEKIFGFADAEEDDIVVGQFVSLAAGAYVIPLRVYLVCNSIPQLGRPGVGDHAPIMSIDDLPEELEVRIVNGDDEQTTTIGAINTRTGEIKFLDKWVDLKGRKLNAKPTAKGSYYRNGVHEVVK